MKKESKKNNINISRLAAFFGFFAFNIFIFVMKFRLSHALNAFTITLLVIGPAASSLLIKPKVIKFAVSLLCYVPDCVIYSEDIPMVVFFFLPAMFFILMSSSLGKENFNETACTLYMSAGMLLSVAKVIYTIINHQQIIPAFYFTHMNFFQAVSLVAILFLLFKSGVDSKDDKKRFSYSKAMLSLIALSFITDFICDLFCANGPGDLLYILNWAILYGCMIYDENPHITHFSEKIKLFGQ